MYKIVVLAAFCCLVNAGKLPKSEKSVHQIIQDAQGAEPVELIVYNKTYLNLVVQNTKNVLQTHDLSNCSEDPEERQLTSWCYQNIAELLGEALKKTEIGQKGHFTVTIGTTNRAFTYLENPPVTVDLLFALDQLFVEIQWFQD